MSVSDVLLAVPRAWEPKRYATATSCCSRSCFSCFCCCGVMGMTLLYTRTHLFVEALRCAWGETRPKFSGPAVLAGTLCRERDSNSHELAPAGF